MRRVISAMVLGGALVLGLGCAGTAEMLGDMAGLDLQMKLGDAAVHPADFPATAPEGGAKQMSLALTTSSDAVNLPEGVSIELDEGAMYRTELITYQLPPADVDAAVRAAVGELTAASFEEKPVKEAPEEAQVHLFAKGTTMFLVMGGAEEGDDGVLVLMRLEPAPAE